LPFARSARRQTCAAASGRADRITNSIRTNLSSDAARRRARKITGAGAHAPRGATSGSRDRNAGDQHDPSGRRPAYCERRCARSVDGGTTPFSRMYVTRLP
jgi:hypothetical protein